MVRKIKQWVPIDGTRWRNEIANGHENDGVSVHYGFAHRGPMTLMPDTIKTGTRLIEGGALLPESVRSESEPWTSFYMAGEIIREFRKAHENKHVSVAATKGDMRKAA